ncbi:5782_t:CDS:2, partial [Gigaspora rosea]
RCTSEDNINKQTYFVDYRNAEISNAQIIPEHGSMTDNQDQIKDKENLELVIPSNFIPNKKRRFHALQ